MMPNLLRFVALRSPLARPKARFDKRHRLEQRFSELADAAPAMLWMTDARGSCTFLSRGWYEFTGQTEATGLGAGWTDAIHPDDRQAAYESFRSANLRRSPLQLDYRLRCRD